MKRFLFGDDPQPAMTEQEMRRHMNRELGQAKSALQAIRWLYLSIAFLTLVLLVAWYLPSATEELSKIGLTLLVAQIVFELVGAWRTFKEPVLWSVFPAVAQTLLLAWAASEGVLRDWIARSILYMLTGGLWSTVFLAHRASKYLRQFPELRMARRFRGEVLAEEGEARRESASRTRHARNRGVFRTLVFGGGAGILVAVAITVIFRAARPTDVQLDLAGFREQWNQHQLDDLCIRFPSESREKLESRFRSWIRRREWEEALPAIDEPTFTVDDGGERAKAIFPMGEDSLETHWRWENQRWELRAFARRIGGNSEE